jgi:cyclophilin family peptidyl-prolyl cis-trans isomerase
MKRVSLLFIAAILTFSAAFGQKNKIKIETEYGDIVLMLYDNTPLNTNNMVKMATEHFYDSTLFHRCIPQFMIQGGDPDSKQAKPGQTLGNGGLGTTIPAEINNVNFHKRGAVGVARDQTPDKSGSPCQFYIVVGKTFTEEELDVMSKRAERDYTLEQREVYKTIGGTPHLDGNYTVFGEVIEGMDVVDKISNEPRDSNDRPNKDIKMISVRVVGDEKKNILSSVRANVKGLFKKKDKKEDKAGAEGK